jgi:hypothetical protein
VNPPTGVLIVLAAADIAPFCWQIAVTLTLPELPIVTVAGSDHSIPFESETTPPTMGVFATPVRVKTTVEGKETNLANPFNFRIESRSVPIAVRGDLAL